MKYALICVNTTERKIETPNLFDALEKAQLAMCQSVAKVLDAPFGNVYDSFRRGVEYDEVTSVLEDRAWAEVSEFGDHRQYDWRIFKLPVVDER